MPGRDESFMGIPPQKLCTSYGTSLKNYTATDSINNSESLIIGINNSNPDRINRDINITVNANGMLEANDGVPGFTNVNSIRLNITYPNGTIQNYSMIHSVFNPSDERYHYVWSTRTTMDNGTYEVRAYPNNGTEYTNFNFGINLSIINVLNYKPKGYIDLNTTNVYRNETFAFNLTVFDQETPFENLTWTLGLYKGGGAAIEEWSTGDALNQTYFIDGIDDILLGTYTFDIIINDADGGQFDSTILSFNVLNHEPIVHNVTLNHTDSIKRETESLYFKANVTDYEDSGTDLEIQVIFQDALTKENLSQSSWEMAYNVSDELYEVELSIPKIAPIGGYDIIIRASDTDNTNTYYYPPENGSIYIDNNLPKVHGVDVNGKAANGVHFPLGNNLEFSLNVSDVEGINYAQVNLVHQGEGSENLTFLTRSAEDYNFTVAGGLLKRGTWFIKVIVHDTDGNKSISSPDSPTFTIEIDPDRSVISSNIVLSIIAGTIGIVVGAAITWQYTKKRVNEIRSEMLIKTAGKKAEPGKGSKAEGNKPKQKEKQPDQGSKKSSSKKGKKTKSRF